MTNMILFYVKREDIIDQLVIVTARNREYAKSKAANFLGGNPDKYIVEPLTQMGYRVHFDITT